MKILLVAGGRTAEASGTLGSAKQLARAADELGHRASLLVLEEDNDRHQWLKALQEVVEHDVVFPLVSGLEGLLSVAGVPFVGSNPAAAGIAAHKGLFNDLLVQRGWPKVPYVYGRADEVALRALEVPLSFPLFVKPARLGASYGISRVQEIGDLVPAIQTSADYDPIVLIEESVSSPYTEYEVPLIVGRASVAARAGAIQLPASSSWHDTESKYSLDTEIRPVLDDSLARCLAEAALSAVTHSGVTGPVRVDLFQDAFGVVHIGELNAIPGHGIASTFPRIFEMSGLSRPDQLSEMLRAAIDVHATTSQERFSV